MTIDGDFCFLVDMSYLIYRSHFAFKTMFVKRKSPNDGIEKFIPTGHIFGAVQTVSSLTSYKKKIILCLDSKATWRYSLWPSYKSGRHARDGYNPFTDLHTILQLCTALPEVYYVKLQDMEADDIIASYQNQLYEHYRITPYILCHDDDLMQSSGKYCLFSEFQKGRFAEPDILNVPEHIKEKYGYDNLTHLPLTEKVLNGDSSDRIPVVFPRLRKDTIREIVLQLKDTTDYETIVNLIEYKYPQIVQKYPSWKKQFDINYQIVKARTVPITVFELKKMYSDQTPLQIAKQYELQSFYELFS